MRARPERLTMVDSGLAACCGPVQRALHDQPSARLQGSCTAVFRGAWTCAFRGAHTGLPVSRLFVSPAGGRMPPLLRRTIAAPFSTRQVLASPATADFDTRTIASLISVADVTMIGSCARRAPRLTRRQGRRGFPFIRKTWTARTRGRSGNDGTGLVGCESPPTPCDRTPEGTFKAGDIAVGQAGR